LFNKQAVPALAFHENINSMPFRPLIVFSLMAMILPFGNKFSTLTFCLKISNNSGLGHSFHKKTPPIRATMHIIGRASFTGVGP
jgi:hypothetical protein